MKKKNIWITLIHYSGIILIIAGVLDPLEGSIIITIGSILISTSLFLIKDSERKKFYLSTILILFGVFFMFYFSSLGGFGGNSKLSWWWALLILPYPIGWLLSIILLIKNWKKYNSKFKNIP